MRYCGFRRAPIGALVCFISIGFGLDALADRTGAAEPTETLDAQYGDMMRVYEALHKAASSASNSSASNSSERRPPFALPWQLDPGRLLQPDKLTPAQARKIESINLSQEPPLSEWWRRAPRWIQLPVMPLHAGTAFATLSFGVGRNPQEPTMTYDDSGGKPVTVKLADREISGENGEGYWRTTRIAPRKHGARSVIPPFLNVTYLGPYQAAHDESKWHAYFRWSDDSQLLPDLVWTSGDRAARVNLEGRALARIERAAKMSNATIRTNARAAKADLEKAQAKRMRAIPRGLRPDRRRVDHYSLREIRGVPLRRAAP